MRNVNEDMKSVISHHESFRWISVLISSEHGEFSTIQSSCSEAKNHGFTVDGSFQQYVVSYAQHCTPIPHSLSMELAAPILCAGVTVFAALKAIGGRKGETVVIPGAGGGLGHLCVQYALAMDYKVLAIDSGENKRALLASYGVQGDAFIDYKNE